MSLINEKMMWDGQGPVFIGDYDPIKGTPEMGYLINVYQIGCGTSVFTTSPAIETESVKETCTGLRADLDSRVSSTTLEAGLSMYQFDGRTLAAGFFGDAIEVAVGTVTDETLSEEVEIGGYFFTSFPNIKNLVVRDKAGTDLVLDTHYAIEDAKTGRIRLLALPATDPLGEMDYEYDPHVHFSIFSTAGLRERGVIFCGINAKGQRARVTLPRVNFVMGGDFGWIGDENANLELNGNVLMSQELQYHPQFRGGYGRVELLPQLP